MVTKRDLRAMRLLQDMPDHLLERLMEVVHQQHLPAETVLFRQNEPLTAFYMVLSGQVRLQIETPLKTTVTLALVQPGFSLGVSAFIPQSRSSATAVCTQACELIVLETQEAGPLFEQDGELGYNMLMRVVRGFKDRMNQRTQLFLDSLKKHPELRKLFEGTEDQFQAEGSVL